jgi:thioredoxin reductase (NADPH)
MRGPSVPTIFDVLVVGAGPTGLACAIEVQRRGLRVVVVEKGCVVNSLYHYPVNMTFFTTPELLEIGDIPMTAMRDKPTRTEALKYYRRVAEHYRLDLRQYERVEAIKGAEGDFQIETIDRGNRSGLYRAKTVILATGYYDLPVRMNIPGEDLDKVFHYYREPHPFYHCEVAVIGGKNSAAVAALECHRAEARVTLIHRGKELSEKIKYWIRPDIENRLRSGEIQGYFETTVEEITPEAIHIRTRQGEKVLANDFVLALTGYQPDTEFLARAGIVFDAETRRPRTNPDTFESDRAGVYLAGVIVAGMNTSEIFIENGRHHGKQIAAAIAAKLR